MADPYGAVIVDNPLAEMTHQTTSRSRWGFDMGARHHSGLQVVFDFAHGKDNGVRGTHLMLELGKSNARETLTTYAQWRVSRLEESIDPLLPNRDSTIATLGARYEPGSRWTFGLEYRHGFKSEPQSNQLAVQFRIRT